MPFTSSPDFIAAARLIPRLQASIIPSSLPLGLDGALNPASTQAVPFHIKANPYHRTRLLQNVEHARTLLLHLDQSAQQIKVQSQKREVLKKLAEWRGIIRHLKAEVEEWAKLYGDSAWYRDAEDVSKENLLAKYGRNKRQRTESMQLDLDVASGNLRDNSSEERVTITTANNQISSSGPPSTASVSPRPTSPSTITQPARLRRRRGLRSPSPPSSPVRGHTTSHEQQPLSPDAALAADATTQLTLTESMSQLATQLRLSAQSFSNQLSIDTKLLDSAAEGLEKNVGGMESAGKRMGMLKKMSEGKGWWGRMMLYAWIFGLWVLMIVVVGIGPKFRF